MDSKHGAHMFFYSSAVAMAIPYSPIPVCSPGYRSPLPYFFLFSYIRKVINFQHQCFTALLLSATQKAHSVSGYDDPYSSALFSSDDRLF